MQVKNRTLGDDAIRGVIRELRERLQEYRNTRSVVSIHLNSIDIVINLVEYGMDSLTPRAILPEEEGWFNAGRMLDELYRNSEWNDLVDGYYQLVDFTKARRYFLA